MGSIHVSSAVVLIAAIFTAHAAFADDFQVRGGSTVVLSSENNTSTASDKVAVMGKSTPVAYYGIGGQFYGGYRGIEGYAIPSGSGYRYGGYFIGANGTAGNYGIYATALGPAGSTKYAGYFNGNVYVYGTIYQTSDERLKLNIKELDSSLDKVCRLKPKTYIYRLDGAMGRALPEGNQIGLLAQDVQEVFPELVKEVPVADPASSQKDKSDGTALSLNYIALIPVLVKAIQEQQAQIDDLKARLAKIDGRQ